MRQKSLSKWLKFILVGIGICLLVVLAYLIPDIGRGWAEEYPEYGHCYYPWLIFIWVSGIPCFAVLVIGWQIASNIGLDKSFSMDNAQKLKIISVLAAADAGFFFVMNIIYMIINISHPGIALASLMVVFVGVAVSVVTAALSHLVRKAADLQEQSDFTI